MYVSEAEDDIWDAVSHSFSSGTLKPKTSLCGKMEQSLKEPYEVQSHKAHRQKELLCSSSAPSPACVFLIFFPARPSKLCKSPQQANCVRPQYAKCTWDGVVRPAELAQGTNVLAFDCSVIKYYLHI